MPSYYPTSGVQTESTEPTPEVSISEDATSEPTPEVSILSEETSPEPTSAVSILESKGENNLRGSTQEEHSSVEGQEGESDIQGTCFECGPHVGGGDCCESVSSYVQNPYHNNMGIGDYTCWNGSHLSLSEKGSFYYVSPEKTTLLEPSACFFSLALDVSECKENHPIQMWATGWGDHNRKWIVRNDGPNYGLQRIYSEACEGMVIGVDANKRLVLQKANASLPAQEWRVPSRRHHIYGDKIPID
ncbi:MAG: hypothetical protein SGILL_005716 [Bacillariaceae sp.]